MNSKTNLTIYVKLFGALRDYAEDQTVEIGVPYNSGVAQVREILINKLIHKPSDDDTALFNRSVFANESAILSERDYLTEDQLLIILPPVCGG